MDKLKPVIEQKFWIFLGLALLMPFVGWYIATSRYAEGVETRETEIDGTFQKVQFAENPPNQEWVDGAKLIVQKEQKRFEVAQKDLWNSQVQEMDWPSDIEHLMKDVPYEGEIVPRALNLYTQGYYRQLREIESRLRPFDYETGKGVLLFDPSVYTHVPEGQWKIHAPTSQEMWNAQIDTWLVRAVFDSIISINRQAEKITEAPVRQLLELTLRGGERGYSGAATASSEGGGDSDTGSPDGDMYAGAGSELSGSGGTATPFKADVRFDLSEELGPAGSGGGYAAASSGGEVSGIFESETSSGGYGSESTVAAAPDRYVDDEEGDPFRTRAFVLGVVMDHRVLPEFMAELSRSDWPIQIIRVQSRALHMDELPLAGRMGTGRPGMPGMGTRPSFGTGTYGAEVGAEGYSGSGVTAYSGAPGSLSRGSFSDSTSSYSARPGGALGALSGGTMPGAARGTHNAAGLVHQAMSEPYLAEVWIGGLITLFRPVEDTAAADGGNGQSPGMNPGTDPIGDAAQIDPTTAAPQGDATTGEEPAAAPTPGPADGSTTPGGESTTVPGTDGSSPGRPPATPAPQTPQPPPDTGNSSTTTEN